MPTPLAQITYNAKLWAPTVSQTDVDRATARLTVTRAKLAERRQWLKDIGLDGKRFYSDAAELGQVRLAIRFLRIVKLALAKRRDVEAHREAA